MSTTRGSFTSRTSPGVSVVKPDNWPDAHPTTGEPFVDGTITIDGNAQEVTVLLPPQEPSREVWATNDVWCEHCERWSAKENHVRNLTDEEHEQAMAQWREYLAEWQMSGGRFLVPGLEETSGHFVTASGAKARGVLTERGWQWEP